MSATVCPFIAIATDSGKRLSGANAAHACFAQRPSQPIELDHQERLCLTATFTSCTLFVAWAAREAAQAISTATPPAVGSDAWSTSQGVSVDALAAASRGEGEQPFDTSNDGTIWSLAAESQQPLSPEEEERVRVVPLHQRRALEDEVPHAMIRLPRRLSSLRSFAAFVLLLGVALFAAPSIFKGIGALVSGQRVDELAVQLLRGLETGWRYRKQYVEGLLGRWAALRPERRFRELSLRVQAAADRLRAMGPEETLKRGYALIQTPDGKLIRKAKAARDQGDLVVRFVDGKVEVKVKGKRE